MACAPIPADILVFKALFLKFSFELHGYKGNKFGVKTKAYAQRCEGNRCVCIFILLKNQLNIYMWGLMTFSYIFFIKLHMLL